MNQRINIVIPMAGHGSRFSQAGYLAPKPLIDVFGRTMIESVIKNLTPSFDFKFIFICQRQHYIDYQLENIFLKSLGEKWEVVLLDGVTEGAACTVLTAKNIIEEENDLVIANSDQILDCCFSDFIEDARNRNLNGSIMTFPATETKWSYAKLNL